MKNTLSIGLVAAALATLSACTEAPRAESRRSPQPAPEVAAQPLITTSFLVNAGPSLTMDMIFYAFHDTAFALPFFNVQPERNTTLFTFPTYYDFLFPTYEYEPS